jgi:cytochrome P450
MRVLTIVGFGQERGSELTSVPVGHRETLFECLEVILQNILLTVVFHSLRVPNLFLPAVLKKLKVSVREFKLYMEESVLQHMQTTHMKASSSETSGRSRSLLESLICANEAGKSEETKQGTRPSYLTESELYSNIFVFNLAGYETTSGTLTLALPYLATHPELQDWVSKTLSPTVRCQITQLRIQIWYAVKQSCTRHCVSHRTHHCEQTSIIPKTREMNSC